MNKHPDAPPPDIEALKSWAIKTIDMAHTSLSTSKVFIPYNRTATRYMIEQLEKIPQLIIEAKEKSVKTIINCDSEQSSKCFNPKPGTVIQVSRKAGSNDYHIGLVIDPILYGRRSDHPRPKPNSGRQNICIVVLCPGTYPVCNEGQTRYIENFEIIQFWNKTVTLKPNQD